MASTDVNAQIDKTHDVKSSIVAASPKAAEGGEAKTKGEDTTNNALTGIVSGPCPQCESLIQRPDGVDVWQCVKCGAELKLSETGTEFVDTSRDSLLSQRSGWESKLVEPVTFSNVMQKQMGLHSVSVTQSQDKAGNLVVVAPGGTGHNYGNVDDIGQRARNNTCSRVNDVPSRQYANVQHGGAKHGARGVDGRDGASGASGRGGITGSNGGPGGDGGTHKLVSFSFPFFANFFYTSLSFFNHSVNQPFANFRKWPTGAEWNEWNPWPARQRFDEVGAKSITLWLKRWVDNHYQWCKGTAG